MGDEMHEPPRISEAIGWLADLQYTHGNLPVVDTIDRPIQFEYRAEPYEHIVVRA